MATNLVFRHILEAAGGPDTTKIKDVYLQSKDGTYGARDATAGTVIVPAGTQVPEVGGGVFVYDLETAPLYTTEMRVEFVMRVEQDDGDVFWSRGYVDPFQATGPDTSLADYAMSVAELFGRIGLAVEDSYNERYGPPAIVKEINNVALDLTVDAKIIEETMIIQTLEGQSEYDIKTLAENIGVRDYVILHRMLFDNGDEKTPLPTTQRLLDQQWREDFEGNPYRWHVDTVDWGKFKLWGTPRADGDPVPLTTNNLTVTFYAAPIKVDETLLDYSSVYLDPKLPATVNQAIIYGVASNLLIAETDRAVIDKGIEYNYRAKAEKGKMLREVGLGAPLDDARPL